MICLINLGNSNIQSVKNTLEYLNIDYFVTDDYRELAKCDKIILPGVGTFGSGSQRLKDLNMFTTIKKEVLVNKKPILGICLGMQLLFNSSSESIGYEGLGLIDGEILSLPTSENYQIPRIGWAESIINFDFLGLNKNKIIDFYYIHSYYVQPKDLSIISITTDDKITSAIKFKNIYGCQFHPEKSHTSGLNIIKAFAELEQIQ